MSKRDAVAQKKARSRGGGRATRSSLRVYLLVGGVALAIVAGSLVYLSDSRQSPEPPSSSSNGASPSVASVAIVGKSAPGFALPNQYGRAYTFTPGDGKNHVLVFFMGNF